ncbi:hypothetical protein VRK_07080 [Vibrio sp. MEBiC08052]|nr:hypothetical protein VRK_07080 [Vibrio sp. MEBiC08052]
MFLVMLSRLQRKVYGTEASLPASHVIIKQKANVFVVGL